MTSKKYDIWRQSLTVATVVTVEQLSRAEKYGLSIVLFWDNRKHCVFKYSVLFGR
jgi:hypothetical protein